MIPDSFFLGIPSIRANTQHAIIDKSSIPECLCQNSFLLKSWVKPESIYALNLHSHTLTEIGEKTGFSSSEADSLSIPGLTTRVFRELG
ncbi:hypothetical protein SAMN05216419_10335 [Nitrosomonas cryotolerans]|nr:hypothetical protein SAMN05216419_10335 [Nitrosomonas cryotolerans]